MHEDFIMPSRGIAIFIHPFASLVMRVDRLNASNGGVTQTSAHPFSPES